MLADLAVDVMTEAVQVTLMIVALLVVPGLLMGLVVSLFQAATQINEQTLSFLPRLVVTLGVIALAARWLASTLMDFCVRMFQLAATLAA
jgi:flagellar biosynthesis protein FliQ